MDKYFGLCRAKCIEPGDMFGKTIEGYYQYLEEEVDMELYKRHWISDSIGDIYDIDPSTLEYVKKPESCEWRGDEDGIWECSKCGYSFPYTPYAIPYDIGIMYCPKCGRVIKSLKYYKRVVITNFGDPESNKSMTISLGEYKLWEQNLNGATHEK